MYVPDAVALFSAAGVTDLDGGYLKVDSRATAKRFGEACRTLRVWDRSL